MTTAAIARRATALALPILAAAPGVAAASEAAGPTKSVLSPDLVTSGVTLVVFLALTAILYRYAWGPILKGLEAREANQFKAIDDARLAREEAAKMRADLQAESAKAQDEIRALMDEARKDAEALRAKGREAGVKDAAEERDRAKREIDAAKDAALQEIYQRSVQLAALMSSKAIRRQLTVDDQTRLVQESLAELKAGVGRG